MQYKRISADCHLDLPWLPPELFVSEARRELKERMPYVEDGPDGPHWVTKAGVNMGLVDGIGSVGGQICPRSELPRRQDGRDRPLRGRQEGRAAPGRPRISASRTWTATGSMPRSSLASLVSPRGSATAKPPTRCCASTTTGSRGSAAITPTARSASPACPMAMSRPRPPEVYRVAKLGLKGLELSCSWDMEPMWHPVWEPLVEGGQRRPIAAALPHLPDDLAKGARDGVRSGRSGPRGSPGSPAFQMNLINIIAAIIGAGVLERYPNLRIGLRRKRHRLAPLRARPDGFRV